MFESRNRLNVRWAHKKRDGVSAKPPPDEAARREHRPEMSSVLMSETVKAVRLLFARLRRCNRVNQR
ncbi:MAG TPA: hypothetical protein DDX19_03440 [Rhodopirellula baltica]|nr:hypothetical protein [Rhodopirellula baltica]